MPEISVLLPVYNTRPAYLRACIDSILKQTFADFELLIINDASPDESVEKIILSYADPRLIYEKNHKNLGISATRNKLLQKASGKYLAVMDHDDISLQERFEKQKVFLDTHPQIGVVSTAFREIPKNKAHLPPLESAEIKENLMMNCPVLHPAAMIRKSILKDIFYEADFSPAEDYRLWCRLLPLTEFANLPDILFLYRKHRQNTSVIQNTAMEIAGNRIRAEVRLENPKLWIRVQNCITFVRTVRFCGLPILKIRKTRQRTKFYFCGMPILTFKDSLTH